MIKKLISVIFCVFLLASCNHQTTTGPTPPPIPPPPEPPDADYLEVIQVQNSPNPLDGFLTSPASLKIGQPITIIVKYIVSKEHFVLHQPPDKWVHVTSCLSTDGIGCLPGSGRGSGIQERSGTVMNSNVQPGNPGDVNQTKYIINYLDFDEVPYTPSTRRLLYTASPFPFEINYY